MRAVKGRNSLLFTILLLPYLLSSIGCSSSSKYAGKTDRQVTREETHLDATEIGLPFYGTNNVGSGYSSLSRWYTFYLYQAQEVTIDLYLDEPWKDIFVVLYDVNLGEINSAVNYSKPKNISRNLEPGRYYCRVYTNDIWQSGSIYSLHILSKNTATERTEVQPEKIKLYEWHRENAVKLTPGQQETILLGTGSGYKNRWYYFELKSKAAVDIQVEKPTSANMLEMELYARERSSIAKASKQPACLQIKSELAKGKYYVQLYSAAEQPNDRVILKFFSSESGKSLPTAAAGSGSGKTEVKPYPTTKQPKSTSSSKTDRHDDGLKNDKTQPGSDPASTEKNKAPDRKKRNTPKADEPLRSPDKIKIRKKP